MMSNYQQEIPNFTISQESLSNLFEANNINSLGIHEIISALETNVETGIIGDTRDLSRRHNSFGSNQNFEEKPSLLTKGFYNLIFEALKDTTIILLLCCATLSLVIGIKRNGPQEGFRDGAIIFLALFIVINFGVICKFYKARKMMKKKKDVVGVIRGGKMLQIPVTEIVVGDILCLNIHDRIPADGLFISDNYSLNLDDGSNYHECPFMFTGSKAVAGNCRMLVTSVGKNTERSKLMKSVTSHEVEESKLQTAISKTSSRLEKIWVSLTLVLLGVQAIRCFVGGSDCDENHDPDPKGVKNTVEEVMNEATRIMKRQGFGVNGLVGMMFILVLATRDGLPLGILTFLAYVSKKMKSYSRVRNLSACATTGLVTTICTGKTGDLTLHHLKMAKLWIGTDRNKEVPMDLVALDVLNTLREGICMNDNASGPAEDYLLWWAKRGLGMDVEELNRSCTILHNESFDLNRNRSGLSLRRNGEGGNIVHVHWKGDPEKILSMCLQYYDVDGTMQTLDEHKRAAFNEIIESVSSDSFQCFAFAYKKLIIQEEEVEEEEESLKPKQEEEEEEEEEGKECQKPIEDGLTLLGLVGLKNPYALEVREAIKDCAKFGIKIKLVVEDDINTARLMAIHSGILSPEDQIEGAVIEASEFRNKSKEDRMSMIDNIRVMAKTSPSDKLLTVQSLRQKGEVVAVTGTFPRDSPTLKEADVGLFMGNNGAELDKENVDVVVLDLNFGTICEILKLGRCVCNKLEKFIQSQIIFNIAAFSINFIVVIYTSEVPLTPFQLFWINIIMDVLGALALAASMEDPPSAQTQIETCPPVYGTGPIITKNMWRNIAIQSLYQIIVLLILDLKGISIFHVDESVLKAMIFNCYVLCQIFLLIGPIEIEKINVFKKIEFLVIVGVIVILQVAVIEIAVVTSHTGRLDLKQWCICIGIASVSLLIDSAAKWFSNILYEAI